MEKGLRDLREKTRVLMEAKESEIKSLNETNVEFRKLLEKQQNYSRWEHEWFFDDNFLLKLQR